MQGFENQNFDAGEKKGKNCRVVSTRQDCYNDWRFSGVWEHVQKSSSPCWVGVILILGGPYLFAAARG